MYKIGVLCYFFLSPFWLFSQADSSSFFNPSLSLNRNKVSFLLGTEVVGYFGTISMLNSLWYKDYPRSSFHFFNDNSEWLQMDKLGHATTSYYVGYLGMKSLEWCGVKSNKALWYGGTLGFFFLSSVETLDGYSKAWGASMGDVVANTTGFLLLAGQQLAWDNQRVILKYSAHFSEYAKYRPNVLGSTWNEQLLKDYNGQSYWLSINLSSFLSENNKFPNWLNIAVGYSGEGMIGGHDNPTINSEGELLPTFIRYRQYLLSLDVDLTRIKSKSPFLNTLLGSLGFVKFPFPALEYNNQDGIKAHLIYF